MSLQWWSIFLLLLLCSPAVSLGFTILGEIFAYLTVCLIQPLRQSHSVFVDGACWVCFCCWHWPVQDMNIRIFWVCAMECMCAQTRPRSILSSKSFWGMESELMVTPREKSPLVEKFSPDEDRTHYTASSRTVSPRHSQRLIPAPWLRLKSIATKHRWIGQEKGKK